MNRKRKKRKPKDRISRRMQGRLWIVFSLICILFVTLIGRLMYIERTSGERYEKIVLSQQEFDSRIIPFQRGNITDAKGTVLATSIDVYNVILDSKVLNANPECIDTTIRYITQVFPEISSDTIRNEISEHPTASYKVLAKKVSFEKMSDFLAMMEDETTGEQIAGIWFEKEYIRSYPYGSTAGGVIGFTTSGNAGMTGLELQYNDTLNGINGRSYGYLNNDSNLEQTVIEPENGRTIVTSIDINIQSIVEQEILKWNSEYASEDSLGSKNTACLVMNPNTGEILAMATYPGFDPNDPWTLEGIIKEEELSAMTDEEKLEKLNRIWQNFPVTSTYEPGSTFKPFTIACGLDTGTLTSNDTFYCDGGEQIGPHYIRCFTTVGHGMDTLEDALSDSCNDALMQMSYRIGAHNFARYQHLFGFGQRTYVDLPGEARTDGLIYNEEELESTVNIATNSFGQNFNTTMVQLGSAFCSLINGGHLYQPHLVTRITDAKGNIISETQPISLKETVAEETSEELKRYLHTVVSSGTGKVAEVPGYEIGGKTGTAEKQPRGNEKYLVSFIGFAPVDDPQIMVYVVVDEANAEDQGRSAYAMTIAHNVFEQVLPYLNIPRAYVPEETGAEEQETGEGAETEETATEEAAAAEEEISYAIEAAPEEAPQTEETVQEEQAAQIDESAQTQQTENTEQTGE
ncbi:MAG: peptidoglycan glycosyltransferase [Lachnospiraceae bacterium]|nr:peptidoglycan glycosyltransferase [Lachnospiraceae bacterium]